MRWPVNVNHRLEFLVMNEMPPRRRIGRSIGAVLAGILSGARAFRRARIGINVAYLSGLWISCAGDLLCHDALVTTLRKKIG